MSACKTVLLLGGYGGVGRRIAPLLLRETDVRLIVAGRDSAAAAALAAELAHEFPGRVAWRMADAAAPQGLAAAFDGVDLVVMLVPAPALTAGVARAALAAGCDYLDILVSAEAAARLAEVAPEIAAAGRVFITQAGFHPGLPAVFVRRAAACFDRYESAIVAMAMNARFERPEQAVEIVALVDEPVEICVGGRWRRASYRDTKRLPMGRFGTVTLFPLEMIELKCMQERFQLQETGVYVSGFNGFVDSVVLPLIYMAQKIRKGLAAKALTRLFVWGVNTFSPDRPGVVFMNEATGWKEGRRIRVRVIAEHDDAYEFTAIPVVACLRQHFAGLLPPGLHLMGHAVDDALLFAEMERLGVRIRVEAVPLD